MLWETGKEVDGNIILAASCVSKIIQKQKKKCLLKKSAQGYLLIHYLTATLPYITLLLIHYHLLQFYSSSVRPAILVLLVLKHTIMLSHQPL